jgi:hypothetical protein
MVTPLAVSTDYDLCALIAFEVVGPALPIARTAPYYDQPIAYVGAPATIYGDDMAPMFRGNYAGGSLVTAQTAKGASGSAVFTSDGVIGVLVGVSPRFDGLTFIESRTHLLQFMESL